MELLSLIRRKHAGLELAPGDIHKLVAAMVAGEVADYQLSALLMAVCYEGLSYEETFALTEAYVNSGAGVMEWGEFDGPLVDKHSTGGVGDKVSLLLAPWMVAAGMYMPKMSGRGLGHTGGTIDKLEGIPGFRADLDRDELHSVVRKAGCAVAEQTADLVPADRQTYALRDATDTVDEIGLIAASVMSKKLVSGAPFIVLDVKCGSGAFFRDESRAMQFAKVASRLGRDFGREVACVISDMDVPLGCAVGNALEVIEVVEFLKGEALLYDLQVVCEALGSTLMVLTGQFDIDDRESAVESMRKTLMDGEVLGVFERWISAQGGDLAGLYRKMEALGDYRRIEISADSACWIGEMDALAIGELAQSLGAGRFTKADVIDPLVGLLCHRKTSDSVVPEAPLATIIAKPDEPRSDSDLRREYLSALKFEHTPPGERKIIHGIVSQGWDE